MVFLTKEDWKYEGSKAGVEGGGRTHTFGLRKPSTRLKGSIVYALAGVGIKDSRPILIARD